MLSAWLIAFKGKAQLLNEHFMSCKIPNMGSLLSERHGDKPMRPQLARDNILMNRPTLDGNPERSESATSQPPCFASNPPNGAILLVRCGNKAYNYSHLSHLTPFKLPGFQLGFTDHVIHCTEDTL